MPNPYGTLAGFSDPEEPGWQERAMERVRERQRRNRGGATFKRKHRAQIDFDTPFKLMLDEAASRRGISMGGYIRRATAAFLAHDLDVPFTEVVRYCPAPAPYGKGGPQQDSTGDGGEGYGEWVVR